MFDFEFLFILYILSSASFTDSFKSPENLVIPYEKVGLTL